MAGDPRHGLALVEMFSSPSNGNYESPKKTSTTMSHPNNFYPPPPQQAQTSPPPSPNKQTKKQQHATSSATPTPSHPTPLPPGLVPASGDLALVRAFASTREASGGPHFHDKIRAVHLMPFLPALAPDDVGVFFFREICLSGHAGAMWEGFVYVAWISPRCIVCLASSDRTGNPFRSLEKEPQGQPIYHLKPCGFLKEVTQAQRLTKGAWNPGITYGR